MTNLTIIAIKTELSADEAQHTQFRNDLLALVTQAVDQRYPGLMGLADCRLIRPYIFGDHEQQVAFLTDDERDDFMRSDEAQWDGEGGPFCVDIEPDGTNIYYVDQEDYRPDDEDKDDDDR